MKINRNAMSKLLAYLTAGSEDPVEIERAKKMLAELFGDDQLLIKSGKEIANITREYGPAMSTRAVALVEHARGGDGLGAAFNALMDRQATHPLSNFAFGAPGQSEGGRVVVSKEIDTTALAKIKGRITKAMQAGGQPGGAFVLDFGSGVHVVGRGDGTFFRIEIRGRGQVRPAAGFSYHQASQTWSAETMNLEGCAQLVAFALEGIGGRVQKEQPAAPLSAAAVSALLLAAIRDGESELQIGDVTVIISDDRKTLTVKGPGEEPETFSDVDQAVKSIAARQAVSVQAERASRHPLRQAGFQHSLDRPYTGTDVAT